MADLSKPKTAQHVRRDIQTTRHLRLLQTTTPSPAPLATTLWTAIYVPQLPLQAITTQQCASIVFETQSGRLLIVATNSAAESFGIRTNMTVSAALSLCDALHTHERDLNAECQLLNKVAAIAYCFSDKVTLYAWNTVVLEVRGSLKLFSGLPALQQALQKQLFELKLEAQYCVAPTVRAAAWLAGRGKNIMVTDVAALKSAVRTLPANLIADNPKTTKQLQNCGINTLADYMRLPRKDVNRRFGLHGLKLLQQALGELPELLQYYCPPQPFNTEWHFDDPVTTCERIEQITGELLNRLQRYLQSRCATVQRIVLYLAHADQSISTITIGISHFQHSVAHLQTLLHERLHSHVLQQAVMSLCLNANEIYVLPHENMDLFTTQSSSQHDWQQLLDILQTRLGRKAIKQLSGHDDPRPEHAFQFIGRKKITQSVHPNWPFWLLENPKQLDFSPHNKAFKTINTAERIEQGWWAGVDMRRDYYRTQHSQGGQYWVFQDCRSKQWFLHGLFG